MAAPQITRNVNPDAGRVVVCPRCRDAYLDNGTATEAGRAFANAHGPTCERSPGLSRFEDTASALTLLINAELSVAH